MASVTFKNISKKYNKKDEPVVKDFTLEIADKEFIVLVGPSGCGKSTTLRMIAGLEEITSGELYIDDKLVNNVLPKNRDIAMVFQNYALYPHMTVFDNIAFGLQINKVKKKEIKEKVHYAAQILGLENFLKRKPKSLSGGQRQRVALGRAIVREASVFLMDETLSNLDAKLRVQMRAEIIKLHHSLNTTTIYVTHDQTEALTMATRIVIMNDGEIMQVGTPLEVYDDPGNLFVAQFIGSPAMNIFKSVFDGENIRIGETLIPVSEHYKSLLNNLQYKNKELYFGIRPEHIEIKGVNNEDESLERDALIAVRVKVNELLGSEYMVYAELEGIDFAARVETRCILTQDDLIYLHFNMDQAFFFNYETEERII